MSDPEARYEVLVIGAGNAGLAAAIAAAESGAKVALLEKATKDLNSCVEFGFFHFFLPLVVCH